MFVQRISNHAHPLTEWPNSRISWAHLKVYACAFRCNEPSLQSPQSLWRPQQVRQVALDVLRNRKIAKSDGAYPGGHPECFAICVHYEGPTRTKIKTFTSISPIFQQISAIPANCHQLSDIVGNCWQLTGIAGNSRLLSAICNNTQTQLLQIAAIGCNSSSYYFGNSILLDSPIFSPSKTLPRYSTIVNICQQSPSLQLLGPCPNTCFTCGGKGLLSGMLMIWTQTLTLAHDWWLMTHGSWLMTAYHLYANTWTFTILMIITCFGIYTY